LALVSFIVLAGTGFTIAGEPGQPLEKVNDNLLNILNEIFSRIQIKESFTFSLHKQFCEKSDCVPKGTKCPPERPYEGTAIDCYKGTGMEKMECCKECREPNKLVNYLVNNNKPKPYGEEQGFFQQAFRLDPTDIAGKALLLDHMFWLIVVHQIVDQFIGFPAFLAAFHLFHPGSFVAINRSPFVWSFRGTFGSLWYAIRLLAKTVLWQAESKRFLDLNSTEYFI